jgi:hypothetical protein
MGLFGLGDFGTGFVEGFAKSADEALKEDMRKVDLRVERVAEAKMKRALKQQEERAEELEEIEDALEQGRALFGDDPRASQYAASLLKDQGNIAAYKDLIAKMRTKKNDFGINPADFFERAKVDAPAEKGFSISDYAKAYQGAPKTLPDYRGIDDKTMTAGAGRLLSRIGLDQDVRGQIDSSVAEQMAASGIIEDAAKPSVSLPSIGFDSEEWNLADKDASAKIKYYNEKLVNPRLDEATRAKYEEKLQSQLGIAAESKDDEIRISALQQQLSRANVEDKPAIQKQITEIKVQQKRREAEAAVADRSDIMAVNTLEKADAYRRSQDETLSEEERKKALDDFYRIGEVINDYNKGEPTVEDKFAKRKEDHRRKQVEDPTYKAGNLEFDAEVAELEKLERISTDGSTKDATTASITASGKAIDLFLSSNPTITDNIPNNKNFQRIKIAVDNARTKSEGLARLSTEKSPDGGPSEREIYDQGMAAMRSSGQPLVEKYINSVRKEDRPGAIVAAELLGYDVSAYKTVQSTAPNDTTPADAAPADTTTQPVVSADQMKAAVPDTAEGAKVALTKLGPDVTLEEINDSIALASKNVYGDAFMQVLEQKRNQLIEAAERGEDTNMISDESEKNKISEALKFLKALPARNPLTTSPSEIISKSTKEYEIEKLAEHMNITIDEAAKLWTESYQQRNKEIIQGFLPPRSSNKTPSRRTGRVRRSSGGLMARK